MAKKNDLNKENGLGTPSVLAFERKISPSAGFFFETSWDKPDSDVIPLKIVEKSIRGTNSSRGADTELDPEKRKKKIERANPQTVDSCSLSKDCDTLVIKYTLKILAGVDTPSACDEAKFQEAYRALADNYINEYGFRELSSRYAQNIASGRILWRNRVGARDIYTVVKLVDSDKRWEFDSYDFSLSSFENGEKVKEMASYIADALCGKLPYVYFNVETKARGYLGQEVFPSEEMVLNKRDGDKSKILYQLDGVAAMHSQKIGNAIRTIDTWYEGGNGTPIASEIYGAVTTRGIAYRGDAKSNFYALFDKAVEDGKFKNESDAHYVMSVLVRGGVFGKSSKS